MASTAALRSFSDGIRSTDVIVRSARRGDATAEADVADCPHRPPARRVLAVDVRVERHVHVLVEDVDRGRTAGTRRPELPAVRIQEVSSTLTQREGLGGRIKTMTVSTTTRT